MVIRAGVRVLLPLGVFLFALCFPLGVWGQDTRMPPCFYVGLTSPIDLLLSCAEDGDPQAQNNLGILYEHGEGVPEDDVQAAHWYRLAAEQGLALAQSNLGLMYDKGEGVPKDAAEAVRWFRLAAE